jgi:hypothetical protein
MYRKIPGGGHESPYGQPECAQVTIGGDIHGVVSAVSDEEALWI